MEPERTAEIGRRGWGVALGLACGLAVLLLPPPAGMPAPAWRVAAAMTLMAVWWVSEAIPIAATALVPLALFPSLGVAELDEVARPYASPVVFLMMGGLMIGLALQRSGLHRRLALLVLRLTGRRSDFLVGGFMLATGLLSMWISNTATAAMMVPIGRSVIELVRESEEGGDALPTALLLGIAYGANVGGIGTLIGTPPNAVLAGAMAAYGIDIGFADWLVIGLPTALVLLAGVFLLAGLAWLGRPLAEALWPDVVLSDAGIAVAAALLLFVLPDGGQDGAPLLPWPATRELPWNVLILIGGGLSLGAAIDSSGLAGWVGEALAGLRAWPVPLVVIAGAAVALLLSHVMSNTATAAALVPLLVTLAGQLGQPPLRLALPAVLACSCAFMLPVATPPNAIVHGTGLITTPTMARAGAPLAAVAIVVVLVTSRLLGGLVAPG